MREVLAQRFKVQLAQDRHSADRIVQGTGELARVLERPLRMPEQDQHQSPYRPRQRPSRSVATELDRGRNLRLGAIPFS